MRARSDADTWHLATAPVEITSDRRSRARLRGLLVAVLLTLATLAALRIYVEISGPAARTAQLERTNAALDADVARLRAELEIERATREALEQQVTDLNQQSSELASQLNFYNAQNGRPNAGR